MDDTAAAASDFIAKWQGVTASELSTSQSFLTGLCQLLDVPVPHPTPEQDYMFERPITFSHGDGSTSAGRIDLYRRGHFVLESKKVKAGAHTKGFDEALLKARSQAEGYARALPAGEGRPPFLLVVDVGHVIELYSEFSRSGGTYTPFPDPASHRIRLAELEQPAVRERLRQVWLNPDALDPAKVSAKVTRAIAADLAQLAKSLESAGHDPEPVARFLTRALFTMFAEDVGLLPEHAFRQLLADCGKSPEGFVPLVGELWRTMDSGGFSAALRTDVLRFNGKLFHAAEALPLDAAQIALLHRAAEHDWKFVEPAIFGTLLERALNPSERHSLGAHYTPRAYVERLVLPTVIEPLRAEWADARAGALTLAAEGDAKGAQSLVRGFLQQLCTVRVLDPACGSGNFLYVTLEHMKRLEGEVLNQLAELGDTQSLLDLAGVSVDPHQFLGLELNPRAAALAELVLWIGYLQWHYRTRGHVNPPQPVLRDFRNIECRDAVLAYDSKELLLDESGQPVTRWDGKTYKPSPITGENIPDESVQVPEYLYINPQEAEPWPAADFIVGNPPYIGNKRMRTLLGNGYVDALRDAWKQVPDTVDFVMYWWERCAVLVRNANCRAFGLITTNSLRQIQNRQVTARHLNDKAALVLRFVIPDHPWIDNADGADVRVAMTVADSRNFDGRLFTVTDESPGEYGEIRISANERRGLIHADLSVGANVSVAKKLRANERICFQGMNLVGKGFRLSEAEVIKLGYQPEVLPGVIKPYSNARDLMQGGGTSFVIDFFGLNAEEAMRNHPALYQWLLDRVKPERDLNNDAQRKRDWWLFGRSNATLRDAWQEINRYLVTPETSKHRVFTFVDKPFCPDHKLYAICVDSAWLLGVLSSSLHRAWSLAAGGTLEDRPTWTNTTCFATFPFPSFGPATKFNQPLDFDSDGDDPWQLACRIEELGESIDAHRKRQQRDYPALTLTGMYNVLEKLRSGEALNAKEKAIHEQGLVSVLKQYHDELDSAVLAAYGWNDLAPLQQVVNGNAAPSSLGLESRAAAQQALNDALLEQLVALNAERAAEEAQGNIRWLRPEFQNPQRDDEPSSGRQQSIGLPEEVESETTETSAASLEVQPWPKEPSEQARTVADALGAQPQTLEQIAARFKGKGPWKKRLPALLQMLVALGRAREEGEGFVVG